MSRRDWRHYRERQRGRGRGREAPKNARDAVEALLREELGGRGFRAALEVEAGEAAGRGGVAQRPAPRPDRAADLHRRPGDRARLRRRRLGAARGRRRSALWIHIADVAAHVPPGSPLDREARRRGNSTYVPGAVEPMLPHALSEEACSLAPGVERLAVTAEIELGPGGRPRQRELLPQPHPLRRAARLRRARRRLRRPRAEAPEAVAEPLAVAREAAAALGERRGATSLDVESFEPEFRFDSRGNVVGARGVAQTESHR